jgi:hypothetical protein
MSLYLTACTRFSFSEMHLSRDSSQFSLQVPITQGIKFFRFFFRKLTLLDAAPGEFETIAVTMTATWPVGGRASSGPEGGFRGVFGPFSSRLAKGFRGPLNRPARGP